MRLLILRIGTDSTLSGLDGSWVVDSPNGQPVRSIHEPYHRGSACWQVRIIKEKMEVVCTVVDCVDGGCGKTLYEKTVALVPGAIVLNDLHIESPKMVQPRVSFRSLEMQELMDRYHLRSVRRIKPNGRIYKRFANGAFTQRVFSDGMVTQERNGFGMPADFVVRGATWVVTESVVYGCVPRRVLHTLEKLTPEMAESFEQNGLH